MLLVLVELLVFVIMVGVGWRGGVVGIGGSDDEGGGGTGGIVVVAAMNANLAGVLVFGMLSGKVIFVVGAVGLEGRERRSHAFRRCGRDADITLGAGRSGAEVSTLGDL